MNFRTLSRGLGVLTLLAALEAAGGEGNGTIPLGAPPPNTTTTLWNWLGFPQGRNQVTDARANRLGNNPARERVDPETRIADPANAAAKNPEISAAAKIKADQDDAQQKIKAIKFLATVGCGCRADNTEVRTALLASLDDCTEAVRYEAAKAFCQLAAAAKCQCGSCGCCSAEVMNKLNDMANGTTPEGCPLEPSPRVRMAACQALQACQAARSPTVSPEPTTPPPSTTPLERRSTQFIPQLPAVEMTAVEHIFGLAPSVTQEPTAVSFGADPAAGLDPGLAMVEDHTVAPPCVGRTAYEQPQATLASNPSNATPPNAAPPAAGSILAFFERPLRGVPINTNIPRGELPENRATAQLLQSLEAQSRFPRIDCTQVCYYWDAPALAYQPLYFEEENLERYGYSMPLPYFTQSAVSCGKFFLTVPILPYKMGADPLNECVYDLGFYRPGDCAPHQVHYPPASIRGGLVQAATMTGVIFAVP